MTLLLSSLILILITEESLDPCDLAIGVAFTTNVRGGESGGRGGGARRRAAGGGGPGGPGSFLADFDVKNKVFEPGIVKNVEKIYQKQAFGPKTSNVGPAHRSKK